MNALITSLRQDQMNAFRERFRQVDALILDDVAVSRRQGAHAGGVLPHLQCAVRHDKQIVLTSDKPPAAIAGLEQRLRSRFEGGLIADIHPPTREMRLAILRAKAGAGGIELSPGGRRAAGAAQRHQRARARGRAEPRFGDGGGARHRDHAGAGRGGARSVRAPRTRVSVETIQELVSNRFGLSVADLVSHRREREVSYPRQLAMYLSRTLAEASFPSIAEKFGGRDHSTVMYAVRVIENAARRRGGGGSDVARHRRRVARSRDLSERSGRRRAVAAGGGVGLAVHRHRRGGGVGATRSDALEGGDGAPPSRRVCIFPAALILICAWGNSGRPLRLRHPSCCSARRSRRGRTARCIFAVSTRSRSRWATWPGGSPSSSAM